MARPVEPDLATRQTKIDAARESLAKMEAEEAARLHGELASFNARKSASYADLREEQARLDAEHRLTAQCQAEEAARERAAYFADQEQAAIANLGRYLDAVEISERGAAMHMQGRRDAGAALDDLRENLRALAPNGNTSGAGKREFLMRMSERLAAVMRLNRNEPTSQYFGRFNVSMLGLMYQGKEHGWRGQEERTLAGVIDECVTARRAHEAKG